MIAANAIRIAVERLNEFKKKDRREYLVFVLEKRSEARDSRGSRFDEMMDRLWKRMITEDSYREFRSNHVSVVIEVVACLYFEDFFKFLGEIWNFVVRLKSDEYKEEQGMLIHGMIWGVLDVMGSFESELLEKFDKALESSVAEFIVEALCRQTTLNSEFAHHSFDFERRVERYMNPPAFESTDKRLRMQKLRHQLLIDAFTKRQPMPKMKGAAERTALQISTRLFSFFDFGLQVRRLSEVEVEKKPKKKTK